MKRYLKELNIYSVIAIVFVVFIHANAAYLNNVLKYNSYIQAGFYINFIDKLVHVAVPMFIFIAGFKYEMNDKEKQYRIYVKDKLIRIGKPFLIISIFVILVYRGTDFLKYILYNKYSHISIILYNILKDLIKIFFGYNYAYQLWYIPLYFSIIILYPMISRLIKNNKIRLICFIIAGISFSIFYDLYFQKSSFFLIKYPYPFRFVYYFYLFELGTIFYRKNMYLKNGKGIIILYSIALLFNSNMKNIIISGIFYDVVLTPIAVVAYYFIAINLRNDKLMEFLGKNSFYIFLFHEPIF